jgi:dienelactone hydrolase
MTVPAGNGFNGGTVYYPTDTSQGTWGAVAIVPGYSALFANEEAWMGPRLASFGFVVIGIETNSRNDGADARGTQLLAALDYLTQKSSVRSRVDPNRLAVMGHSAGGAGTLLAAVQRPSLKAAIGLAPGTPGTLNVSNNRVPTLVVGGQTDPTVTPSYLDTLYAGLPATTPTAYVQLSGADHLFFTKANTVEIRRLVPWLKIFVDEDTRYTQLMCPALSDTTGVSKYSAKCGIIPAGGAPSSSGVPSSSSHSPSTSASASSATSSSASSSSAASSSAAQQPGGCGAAYRVTSSWSGGYQGEVTVTAGKSAITGWTVKWTLGSGQTVTQLWNGTLSTSGSSVTVTNAAYNGALQASASTTFGFLANGTSSTPTLSCTSS